MRKILQLCCLGILLIPLQALSQTRGIKGTVKEGKEPVIGATIMVKDTKIGTATDYDGNFSLDVPTGSTTIIVKAIGLKTQEISIAGLSEVSVKMAKDNLKLDEVVVTAFGIQKEKRSVGFSQQTVTGDELKKSGEQNVIQSLSGKAAGVLITGSGGTPGASSKILLRGNATFTGNNQPLMVIDGVPMDNSTTQTTAGDYPFNSNLQGVNNSNRAVDINPDDIETINVLKGPAAAALYGVRAGNGAIIITTKKGRGNKGFSAEFSTSMEISQVNKLPDMQLKYSQGTGGGALKADKSGSIGTGTARPGLTSASWGNLTKDSLGITPYDNAKDFFRTGYAYNNSLSLTKSTESSSVRLSIARLDQSGIMENTDFDRTTIRLSAETQMAKKLVGGGTVSYINSGGTRAQNGSNLSGVMLALLRAPNDYKLEGYKNPDGTQRTYFPPYDNPYWTLNENPFRDNVNRILGNIYLTYDPIDWMSVTYRVGTDNYTDQRKQIFAIGSNQPDNAPGGEVSENVLRYFEVYSDLLVTFKKQITKDIGGTLLIGNNLNHRFNQDVYSRGRDLGAPNNYNLNNASNLYASESNATIRTAALFFDMNLNYKKFLFWNFAGRNEWASTFGTEKNNFFYPATSLSLVFTELVTIPYLSFGKIRYAYAQAGISPSPYATTTYFTRQTYTDGFTGGLSFPYQGQNGYGYQATLGNTGLRPERNTGNEVGIDFRFFDGRFGIDYTYFHQKSTDLLVLRPIAPSSGFTASYENLGSMVNKGHELVITAIPVIYKDFTWDVNLNFTKLTNEVLSLAPGVDEINIESAFSSMGSYAIKGKPYGVLYGTKWQRAADGQLLIGANGLPMLDPVRGEIGSPYPNWFAGFRNTFSYKRLSLTFLIDIRNGGDIWNGTYARLNQLGRTAESSDNREKAFVIPGVKADGTANDVVVSSYNYYRTYQGDGGNYAAENAIQDGGWVRLRDLGVNYTYAMPKSVYKYVKQINLGFVARNLWLKTDYKGVDPETSLTGAGSNVGGFDYFNNPGTKSYTFSLKATF